MRGENAEFGRARRKRRDLARERRRKGQKPFCIVNKACDWESATRGKKRKGAKRKPYWALHLGAQEGDKTHRHASASAHTHTHTSTGLAERWGRGIAGLCGVTTRPGGGSVGSGLGHSVPVLRLLLLLWVLGSILCLRSAVGCA